MLSFIWKWDFVPPELHIIGSYSIPIASKRITLNATTLHGVLRSPLPSCTVVPGPVRFQKLGNIGDQRIIGIGISQERTNGEQDLTNSQSRTPLVLEDIQANSSIGIDVTVVDSRGEVDLGRFEWVIGRKVNV